MMTRRAGRRGSAAAREVPAAGPRSSPLRGGGGHAHVRVGERVGGWVDVCVCACVRVVVVVLVVVGGA